MDRSEAFRTLRLAETADHDIVRDAYWHLVRRARLRVGDDSSASQEIARLNEAYGTLVPGTQTRSQPVAGMAARSRNLELIDRIAEWLISEGTRIRARWPGRNPEIATIAVAAIVLVLIADAARASVWATLIVAAVIAIAIWAPWRRVE